MTGWTSTTNPDAAPGVSGASLPGSGEQPAPGGPTAVGFQAAAEPAGPSVPSTRAGRTRTAGSVVTGALGAVGGVAPHVLHHVGPLVGTALVSGAGGTALFGLLGLAASVPMLIRLKRRVGSWWAPTLALVVFALMFTVSAFVIGPRISGTSDTAPGQVTIGHDDSHHD